MSSSQKKTPMMTTKNNNHQRGLHGLLAVGPDDLAQLDAGALDEAPQLVPQSLVMKTAMAAANENSTPATRNTDGAAS